MRAGLLTEFITFLKPEVVKTETGSELNTYVPVHRCRARMTYSGGDRTNENGDIFYSHHINFEIRQGLRFDELYRIEWKNNQYRILSIEHNRQNHSIFITTELINEYGLLQKSSEYGNGGVYGLIYKITNEGTYKNKKVTQVTYYIVDYYNISIDAEGKSKCSLKKQNVSYDTITFDGEIDFDYYGFLTLEEAQKSVIEKYSDYEVEWINHEQ